MARPDLPHAQQGYGGVHHVARSLLAQFPFPAWATRSDEAIEPGDTPDSSGLRGKGR